MKKTPTNERIKITYFEYLRQADGKSDQTIRQIEKVIARFEVFTKCADFKTFDQKQAMGFKQCLAEQELAPATILATTTNLKRFLSWLAMQAGYKRQIKLTDIEYLNLSEKDVRAASAPTEKSFPTFPMIEWVVELMPQESSIEKRDRALIIFTALTGIRDGALISLKLKHFDTSRRLILQNPLEVNTKFSKRIDTFLFPLNDTFEQVFLGWAQYLREELLFAEDDPLFPKTELGQDENNCFMATGLTRQHWANASPVRDVFKQAFVSASLPPFTPHTFRKMIVSEMYRQKLSVPEFKAWSQNLGHEGAMTTLTSYGKLSIEEQGELIRRGLKEEEEDDRTLDAIRKLLDRGR